MCILPLQRSLRPHEYDRDATGDCVHGRSGYCEWCSRDTGRPGIQVRRLGQVTGTSLPDRREEGFKS